MPVGWRLPAGQLWEKDLDRPDAPVTATTISAAVLLATIFALLALLPSFDGAEDQDWGAQEGDDSP
jgi:hypothetical protein